MDTHYQTELDVFCMWCEKEFKDIMVWVGEEWNSWDCPECKKHQLDDRALTQIHQPDLKRR
jgi:hypothetical protein